MVECRSRRDPGLKKRVPAGLEDQEELRQLADLCGAFIGTPDVSQVCNLCAFLMEHGASFAPAASDLVTECDVLGKVMSFCVSQDIESDFVAEIKLMNIVLSLCGDISNSHTGDFLVRLALNRQSSNDETANEVLKGLIPFAKTPCLFDDTFFAALSSRHLDSQSLEPFLDLFVAFTQEAQLYLHNTAFVDFVHHVFGSFNTPTTACQLSLALRNLCSADIHIFDNQVMKRNWLSWFRVADRHIHRNLLEMCLHMTSDQISILSSFQVVTVIKQVISSDDSDIRLSAALSALRRYIEVKPVECHGQYFDEPELDGTAMAVVRHVLNDSFSLRKDAASLMAMVCAGFSGTYGKIFRCSERQDLMNMLVDAIHWTLECDDAELTCSMLKGVHMLVCYASAIGCLNRMRECISQANAQSLISHLRESEADYSLTIERLTP